MQVFNVANVQTNQPPLQQSPLQSRRLTTPHDDDEIPFEFDPEYTPNNNANGHDRELGTHHPSSAALLERQPTPSIVIAGPRYEDINPTSPVSGPPFPLKKKRISKSSISRPTGFSHLVRASDAEEAEVLLTRWDPDGMGKLADPRWAEPIKSRVRQEHNAKAINEVVNALKPSETTFPDGQSLPPRVPNEMRTLTSSNTTRAAQEKVRVSSIVDGRPERPGNSTLRWDGGLMAHPEAGEHEDEMAVESSVLLPSSAQSRGKPITPSPATLQKAVYARIYFENFYLPLLRHSSRKQRLDSPNAIHTAFSKDSLYHPSVNEEQLALQMQMYELINNTASGAETAERSYSSPGPSSSRKATAGEEDVAWLDRNAPPLQSGEQTLHIAYHTVQSKTRISQTELTLPSPPCSQQGKIDIRTFPPPLDLTRGIVKLEDHVSATGGFGDVHKCVYESPSGAMEVAVKAFRFIFTLEDGGTKYAKMVRRELGIWKRLDHPHIVPFLGTATGFGLKGSTSIVSVWMPNGSLHKFLESHDDELGIRHRLQLLFDVANGLDYLHSFPDSPIIHGDLNSNNVLLDANFSALLTDFGLSSFVGIIPQGLTYLAGTTARPGALRWAAPEQLEEAYEKTPKSDIYSFGCIGLQGSFIQLQDSGKVPWSELQYDGAIVANLLRGRHPKRPLSRDIEDPHWDLIQKCWSAVEERPSAEMLMSSLLELLSSCPQSPALRDLMRSP